MSGKKQSPVKSSFNLVIFLLITGILLIVFSVLQQSLSLLSAPFNLNVVLASITILILLISTSLVGKISQRAPKTKTASGELLDQASVIIESIGEGVLTIDGKSNIRLINPEAKEISGWTDDALEMNYQAVLRLVDATGQTIDDSLNPVVLAQKSGQAQTSREFFLKTPSGKTIPIHLQVSPVANSSSLVIAFRDIKLELEKERQQLEFISTASHEMRTPVAAIDGYLGLLANPKICTIDEKALDYVNKAKASSQHLGVLFKNLLDVSKIDDGRLRANLEVINIIEFIESLLQNLLPLAETKGLQLKFLSGQHRNYRGETKLNQTLFIQADRQMLTEAVTNLIENAIKYTKQGLIEIRTSADQQNEVIISVKDSGIGIPAEDLPHLFQKFYRVDNRDTREINGTGLGLYLTRRIIEQLHGRIWVESELGKGSTFFIALPRLNQRQIKQLSNTLQVQPERGESTAITDNSVTTPPVVEKLSPAVLQATDQPTETTPATPTAPNQTQPEINIPTEAQLSTKRTLSRESAERLRQLGYNTTDFTVTESNPWENQPNSNNQP